MPRPTFREILDVMRDRPGRRGRRYVFSDADRDRIAELAEAALGDPMTNDSRNAALDLVERELEVFIVEPS